MFKRIVWYLYSKRILKLIKLEDKINFLIKYKDNLNFYSNVYRNVYIDCLHNDIIKYTENLKYILKQGLETKFVNIRNITQDTYHYTSICFWYSDNNLELLDMQPFIIWLEHVKQFVTWFDKASLSNSNNIDMNNTRRLRPYYYDVENIINIIIENIKKNNYI